MNPNILRVIGPGFLNQVPTLVKLRFPTAPSSYNERRCAEHFLWRHLDRSRHCLPPTSEMATLWPLTSELHRPQITNSTPYTQILRPKPQHMPS